MEFQLQSVYFIYMWLIVYTILNLAYPKEYIYFMLLTCGMILFWNLLCLSVTCDCDVMLTPTLSLK